MYVFVYVEDNNGDSIKQRTHHHSRDDTEKDVLLMSVVVDPNVNGYVYECDVGFHLVTLNNHDRWEGRESHSE